MPRGEHTQLQSDWIQVLGHCCRGLHMPLGSAFLRVHFTLGTVGLFSSLLINLSSSSCKLSSYQLSSAEGRCFFSKSSAKLPERPFIGLVWVTCSPLTNHCGWRSQGSHWPGLVLQQEGRGAGGGVASLRKLRVLLLENGLRAKNEQVSST